MNKHDAIEQLCKLLNLTEEAVSIAEGWSILPPNLQRHFSLILNDYIAAQHPTLAEIYRNASHQDQLRFNRIVEDAQARARSGKNPPHTGIS